MAIVKQISYILNKPTDLVIREIKSKDKNISLQIVYLKELIDAQFLSLNLLQPLLRIPDLFTYSEDDFHRILPIGEIKSLENVDQAINVLCKGFALIIEEEKNIRIAVNVSASNQRSLEEPKNEKVIRGAHVGFNESVDTNFALLRKQVSHPELLRIEEESLKGTQKKVYFVYIDKVSDPDVIQTLKKRLAKITLDDIPHLQFLEEKIVDKGLSPFPNFQYTERLDKVSSHLLAGKMALFINGSPDAAILPISIKEFLLAPDDYYTNPFWSSVVRLLRFFSLAIAFCLSSFYIALTHINHELIPFNAIQSIIQGREGVPFPIWLEVFILEFVLEVVIEALQRMPENIGATITLMGTLVIGQAVVQAGIIDTTILIIIAFEAIASFAVPIYTVSIFIRLLRFPMVLLALFFGTIGIFWYLILIVIHLARKENFGYPYLSPFSPVSFRAWKDSIVRLPRKWLQKEPVHSD